MLKWVRQLTARSREHTRGLLGSQAVYELVGVDEGELGQHQQQLHYQGGALRAGQLGDQRGQQSRHNGTHLHSKQRQAAAYNVDREIVIELTIELPLFTSRGS